MSAEPSATPDPAAGRIAFEHITHRYRSDRGEPVTALDGVDLTIEPGSFVTVVGPSGCGKTTLLRMAAGFLTPSVGRVVVDGQSVTGPSPQRGVVFQQPTLFPWWTVRRNVEAGPRYRGASRAERERLADYYLGMVGLADFAEAKTYELSGGMQQRCQIARVLANSPQIMLMDEPFGALDSLTRRRLQSDLLLLHHAREDTVLFITHSVEEAVYLGDRVLVMSPRPGRVVHDEILPAHSGEGDGAIEVLRTRPEFAEAVRRITAIIEEEDPTALQARVHTPGSSHRGIAGADDGAKPTA